MNFFFFLRIWFDHTEAHFWVNKAYGYINSQSNFFQMNKGNVKLWKVFFASCLELTLKSGSTRFEFGSLFFSILKFSRFIVEFSYNYFEFLSCLISEFFYWGFLFFNFFLFSLISHFIHFFFVFLLFLFFILFFVLLSLFSEIFVENNNSPYLHSILLFVIEFSSGSWHNKWT